MIYICKYCKINIRHKTKFMKSHDGFCSHTVLKICVFILSNNFFGQISLKFLHGKFFQKWEKKTYFLFAWFWQKNVIDKKSINNPKKIQLWKYFSALLRPEEKRLRQKQINFGPHRPQNSHRHRSPKFENDKKSVFYLDFATSLFLKFPNEKVITIYKLNFHSN